MMTATVRRHHIKSFWVYKVILVGIVLLAMAGIIWQWLTSPRYDGYLPYDSQDREWHP
jgi:hypothetical protein